MDVFDVSADVHALIVDLLPVVCPSARFDPELSRVVVPVGRFEPAMPTLTIVERCAQADPARWPGLVEEWLRDTADRFGLAVADLELFGDIRKRLRVRIEPRLGDERRRWIACRPAGRYFDAVVHIDHPEYGGPLTVHRARLLGLRRIGDYAVPNTYEGELADVQVRDQPITARETVRVVTKPGCRYVSALFTELERFLPDAGRAGALVAIPTHSTILLYPLGAAGPGAVLPALAQVVADMHAASDDPCSPDVFRYGPDRSLVRLDPATRAAADEPRPRRRFWRR
ncbi:hypothetical protein [Thermomonospora amylolytica]|uniref:hypothetical protein n=1 Tax=Thermomonospora amylolytica TaxID=1411117 RepID=UPI000E6C8620|nr:hypothetical protein [Thermomonospora amylolytica]